MEADQVSVPGNAEGSPVDLQSFNAIAQWRGKHQADKSAFIFLADGETEAHELTFGELHRNASSVATWIQEHELVGERVLLLYPPGIDFVIGLLGCLYAGAIAVPAYPQSENIDFCGLSVPGRIRRRDHQIPAARRRQNR